jgi:ribosomal protein S18 acetylase RimI-like enzyme
MAFEVRRLEPADAERVLAASALFDKPPREAATRRFLSEPNHHLLFAIDEDEGRALGFVSGVETTHPDKGTELFLYELSVAEGERRQGIGRALVDALVTLARTRGCYAMWVAVDDDNEAALATYRRAGGRVVSRPLIHEWVF